MLTATSLRCVARLVPRRSAPAALVQRRGYHENIVDHYENPRNVGSLDKNESDVGTVRGPPARAAGPV